LARKPAHAPQLPAALPGVGRFVGNYAGTGSPALALDNRLIFARAEPSSKDSSDIRIHRSANYSGGADWRGFVNAALAVTTTVSEGTHSFEWAGNFILENFGTQADDSENLALAWSAIKRSTGRTLAGFGQITDLSGADPQTTSVVTEFDIYSNGSDAHGNRIFLDLQAFAANTGKGGDGSPGTVTHGVRAVSADGSPITNGYTAGSGVYHCFHAQGEAPGGVLLDDVGSRAIGVNLSAATYTTVAMALAPGQAVAFDNGADGFSRTLSFNQGSFTYSTAEGAVFRISDRGDIDASGDVSVGGTVRAAAICVGDAGKDAPTTDGAIWYDLELGELRCRLKGEVKSIDAKAPAE